MACYTEIFVFALVENILVGCTLMKGLLVENEQKKEIICKTCTQICELFRNS